MRMRGVHSDGSLWFTPRHEPEVAELCGFARRGRLGGGERPHGVSESAHPLVLSHVWWRPIIDSLWSVRGLKTFLMFLNGRSLESACGCSESGARCERVWTAVALDALNRAETVGHVSQRVEATANCQRGSEGGTKMTSRRWVWKTASGGGC